MSTWQPQDLAAVDGVSLEPTILTRTDGARLIYPGRIHWLQGESESHKTWVALLAVAEVLAAGGRVVYIDFEDHAASVKERLILLGVDESVVVDPSRLVYIRPDEPVGGDSDEGWHDLYAAIDEAPVDLIVLDGVTEAMTAEGFDPLSNKDIAAWIALLPRPLQNRTGAAIVVIDHVTKDREGRGKYAIGGQHKRAAVDGAAYMIEAVKPLGRPHKDPVEGLIYVRIAKDRPGAIRGNAHGDTAAVVTITAWPEPGGITWHIEATGVSRDHGLRQKIADLVRGYGADGASTRAIRDLGGSRELIDAAVAGMIADGEIEVAKKGSAHLHTLTDKGHAAYAEAGDE